MIMILLIDDERTFVDGRDCVVARNVADAIEVTDPLDGVDELWLDYVLEGTDSSDEVLSYLFRRQVNGRPFKIGKVYIHTTAWMSVSLLEGWLYRLGVTPENIVRVEDLSIFKKD